MAFKDKWIPQDETMDASPDIPNMLADAIIESEENIEMIPTLITDAIQSAIHDSWGDAV